MSARRVTGPALGILCVLALGGCTTLAGSDGSGPFGGLFGGGASPASAVDAPAPAASGEASARVLQAQVPSAQAPQPAPDVLQEAPCPRVEVIPGRAASRSYAGGRTGSNQALRHQISIAEVARECFAEPDGTNRIRVGVQGRVLIGPQGSAGRFEAPLRIVVRTPSRTFENRVHRVSATVAPGQTQADFVHIEEDLRIPLSVGRNFLIEVGIDR